MRQSLRGIAFCALVFIAVSCRNGAPASTEANSKRANLISAERVPVAAILADPVAFSGRMLQTEAFLEHSEGGFVLSPDETSLSKSTLTNLAYVDASDCRHQQRLPRRSSRNFFLLEGYVIDDQGAASGRSCYRFTFVLIDCTNNANVKQ